MKYLAIIIAAIALTGCASTEYKEYADAQSQIHVARANAEKARYDALANVAQSGTESAKIAAVMALAMGNQGGAQAQGPQVQAPQGSSALQWAQLLIPSVTQLYAVSTSLQLGLAQGTNAARVAESTNNAFVGIAGKIQAPAVMLPQANVSNVSNVTTTSTDRHDTTTGAVSTVGAVSNTTTSTVGANSGENSGNTSAVTTTTSANPVTTTTTNPPGTAKVCATNALGVVDCK